MLLSAVHFPWLAIGAGTTYLLSSGRRVYCLYKDNGIQVAKKSIWSKLKDVSMTSLTVLTAISLFKMITDNYEINWRDSLNIPALRK